MLTPTKKQIATWVNGSTVERKKYASGKVIEQVKEDKEIEFVLEHQHGDTYQLVGVQPFNSHLNGHVSTKVNVFEEFNVE